MKKCKFAKYLVDYTRGEMPEADARTLEIHLQTCTSCATAVSELRTVASILQSRERIPPPVELLATYSQSLARLFTAPRPKPPVSERIEASLRSFFSLRIRLAMGMALLFIGIGIGYFLTHSPQPGVFIEPPTVTIPWLSAESRSISEFITGSEIILLSLSNLESPEKVNPAEIRLYQQQSEHLVRQAAQIRDWAVLLNDADLNILIIDLEKLLLEIANIQQNDLTQKIIEINAATNKLRIFLKVAHLQTELQRLPTPI
ncbi:zf-HC2 domain-containing protein [candidate division KSB1 bacterium]|nr:zf-HC2 domain-containing protein [candidate division KSB1 bacterium]